MHRARHHCFVNVFNLSWLTDCVAVVGGVFKFGCKFVLFSVVTISYFIRHPHNIMEIMNKVGSEDANDKVEFFDEYGFAVFRNGSMSSLCDERNHDFSQKPFDIGVDKEWEKVFSKWMQYKNGIGVKLLGLIKKGVPNTVRPRLWMKLLETEALQSSTSKNFKYKEFASDLREQLVAFGVTEFNIEKAEHELARVEYEERQYKPYDPEIQNLRQIFLDVARTFPTHRLFFGDESQAIEGRALLFRILGIYSKFNTTVGYCQGMSFIAGMLAINLPEEEAFWCLVALLEKPKFLQGYFGASLERVQRHAYVFDRLLKQRLPDLWVHLQNHNLDPLMYVTPWFMCLFTSFPCWDCILSIWDLMLLEGGTVIFRVALAVMISIQPILMEKMDGNTLILILQKLPRNSVSREVLLPIIWKTNVHWWEVEQIQAMIDEEKCTNISATSGQINGGEKASFPWKRVKQKLNAQNKDRTFLKKFSRIFNMKKSSNCAIPEIVITPASPQTCNDDDNDAKENMQGINQKIPALKKNAESMSSSRKSQSPLKRILHSRFLKRKNDQSSISENVSRINRLATGKKGQSRSTVHLEEIVESLVGSHASQKLAFEEFTHQIPLREFEQHEHNISCSSIGSPEKELNCIVVNSSESPADVPLKKRKPSKGSKGQLSSLPFIPSAIGEKLEGKEQESSENTVLLNEKTKRGSIPS